MKTEQIVEVIDKLIGGITPIGETNYDNKVKQNLNTVIEVVRHYVDEICEVAQMNSYCGSIQNCREIARDFVKSLKYAYLDYDVNEHVDNTTETFEKNHGGGNFISALNNPYP